jgi:CheY-like chemotaxis protein
MAAPRVLLVEDNEIYRGILAAGLRHHGLNVEAAGRGDDGLDMMRRCRPDLVLLDLAMPELHGLAVLSQMRADPELASVPVVVLTAHTGRTMEQEVLRRGAVRYLIKTDVGLKDIVRLATDLLAGRSVDAPGDGTGVACDSTVS